MAKDDLLDIVDENDNIVGRDTRENVHAKGLLHREIHIWFITPDGKMIFQHRAKDKDTYPDKLDATVGGHVDLGMNYNDTAIKEMLEETGIHCDMKNLYPLRLMHSTSIDADRNIINKTIRMQYGYIYRGDINSLKVEKGKAVGFESWPIDKIFNLTDDEKKRFIPLIYSNEFLSLFRELEKLVR
ncbi:MAG: NUDIX domain-containing protein [Patescibacteria group bacterium]|nr:NUDIX domain-containing protein [Patescibacteria group bacterium]